MVTGLLVLTVFSTVLASSSNSLFGYWVAVEMVTFFVVPMLNSSKLQSKEAMWEYFLVQSVGSSGFLASSLTGWSVFTLESAGFQEGALNSLSVAYVFLVLKIGLPPFHGWALRLVESMSWAQVMIVLTLSKVAPLFGLWSIVPHCQGINSFILVLSTLVSIKGVIEESIRRAMVYSSVMNVAWVMLGMVVGPSYGAWLFLSYAVSMAGIVMVLDDKMITLLDAFELRYSSPGILWWVSMSTLSLIGFPPSLGFFSKLSALKGLNSGESGGVIFIMYLLSMIHMMIYFWLFSSMVLGSKGCVRPSMNASYSSSMVAMLILLAIFTVISVISQLI
uniref:NADH-ubiquinone oxidoreductase chain 2 n=1 Tax=Polyplax spinulosa TaxID=468197 RepID=V9PXI6_9NEOP|nr:NADH dehydrogenase subunit 2 [Polyplax spinulosa]